MSINQTEQFWKWAEKELEKRNLTWSTVERDAGLSNATISKRARHLLPPTETTCNGIATAMKIPPERVFRMAGLLPPVIIGEEREKELLDLFRNLDVGDQNRVITITRTFYEQRSDNDTEPAPEVRE